MSDPLASRSQSQPRADLNAQRRRHAGLPRGRARMQARMARLIELDGQILARVTRARRSPLTFFLRGLCRAHDPDVVFCLITALLFCGPTAASIANHAGAALISTSLLVVIVKRTVRRARPAGDFQALTPPDRFSFPSGHTAAAFSFALAMFGAMPSLAPVWVVIAVFVGYGRMYLGVHYPMDVLAGACIWVFTGSLVALW